MGDPVHVEHVLPVDADARHPVRAGALGDRRDRELERVGRRVRVPVVVDDPHDRQLMDRRYVQRLVPAAVRGGPVAADRHRDPRLPAHLVRERRPAGDRVGDREVRHHRPGPVPLPVAYVAVAVAAPRVAVDPPPELGHHAVQVQALAQLRGQVAMGREQRVVLAQGGGDAQVGALLAAPRVDRAGEPALAIERLHPLVEVAAELEEVEQVPQLVVGQADAPVLRRELLLLDLRRHGHAPCRGLPASARKASPTPSDNVGWGWISAATSAGTASHATASIDSEIRSVTWGPTMWTPSTGPSLAATILTSPPSPTMFAWPTPWKLNRSTSTSWPRSIACASVMPTDAISGEQ